MDIKTVQKRKKKTFEDVLPLFRAKHGDRYDYIAETFIDVKQKMTMVCKEHGEFQRTPIDHYRLGYGCRQCSRIEVGKSKRISWNDFLLKAHAIHGNTYTYIEPDDFKGYAHTITIICPIHSEFEQKVTHHLSGSGCPLCGQLKSGAKTIIKRMDRGKGKYLLEEYLSTLSKEHLEKYDYSESVYLGSKKPMTVRCKLHNTFFDVIPQKHRKNINNGCKLCSNEAKKTPSTLYFERCKKIHGDRYEYDETSYTHSHDNIRYFCKSCNQWSEQLAYSHENLGNTCPSCKSTKGEIEIREFLEKELNIFPTICDRRSVSGYELDIHVKEQKIAIEFNGNYFHSEIGGRTHPDYHLNKLNKCEEENINLIQIFEDEWKYKKDICQSMIRNRLGKTVNKIFARKCEIKEIDHNVKNLFLHHNHIQGEDQSRIKLGLFYDSELVSVMTFSVPRYDKSYEWELSRFCTKLNTTVVGGASKLLKHFIKNYNPKSIISYADRRWSVGNLYKQLGFEQTRISSPRYYYMKKSRYLVREHRSNYTKDRILKKHPNIDLSKTEWQIMQELNYDRIWDCGMLVFGWNNNKYYLI